jgi:hypothetical protein
MLPSSVLPNYNISAALPYEISHRPRTICSRVCRVYLEIFRMADIHEQCININFGSILGKTFTKTHEMMKNIVVISA